MSSMRSETTSENSSKTESESTTERMNESAFIYKIPGIVRSIAGDAASRTGSAPRLLSSLFSNVVSVLVRGLDYSSSLPEGKKEGVTSLTATLKAQEQSVGDKYPTFKVDGTNNKRS